MKKYITVLMFLTYLLTIGQKKEIKKAEKLFESGDVQGATELLISSETIFNNADEKVLLQKTYLEAKIDQANSNFQSSYEKFLKYKSSGGKDTEYENNILKLTSDIVNSAIEDNAEKKYTEGASKLYLAYTIDKKINEDYLYYAASSSVNGSDFEKALEYYNQLKDLKYEGITTKYFAKSIESGEEVELSESEYNVYKKTKEYSDFREEKTDSRYPEIVKNIALIYAQLGQNDKAMDAVKLARQSDPKDLNLILTEANLYIQLNENDRFEALMKEAIEQDPNNATLYFNLGVVNAQRGNTEDAKNYYKKTISNMQEVIARGAKVLLITNKSKDEVVSENIWETIEVENTNDDLLPFLLTIPLQKLAYYSALKKGYDIDKPRNLAKSVTVE